MLVAARVQVLGGSNLSSEKLVKVKLTYNPLAVPPVRPPFQIDETTERIQQLIQVIDPAENSEAFQEALINLDKILVKYSEETDSFCVSEERFNKNVQDSVRKKGIIKKLVQLLLNDKLDLDLRVRVAQTLINSISYNQESLLLLGKNIKDLLQLVEDNKLGENVMRILRNLSFKCENSLMIYPKLNKICDVIDKGIPQEDKGKFAYAVQTLAHMILSLESNLIQGKIVNKSTSSIEKIIKLFKEGVEDNEMKIELMNFVMNTCHSPELLDKYSDDDKLIMKLFCALKSKDVKTEEVASSILLNLCFNHNGALKFIKYKVFEKLLELKERKGDIFKLRLYNSVVSHCLTNLSEDKKITLIQNIIRDFKMFFESSESVFLPVEHEEYKEFYEELLKNLLGDMICDPNLIRKLSSKYASFFEAVFDEGEEYKVFYENCLGTLPVGIIRDLEEDQQLTREYRELLNRFFTTTKFDNKSS